MYIANATYGVVDNCIHGVCLYCYTHDVSILLRGVFVVRARITLTHNAIHVVYQYCCLFCYSIMSYSVCAGDVT